MYKKSKMLQISIFFAFILIVFQGCGGIKKVDRSIPMSGEERARKNVEEGRGISLGGLGRSSTTYDFSTSNPMWKATLEILDFLPLSTVDYSGGIIITDWYNDAQLQDTSLKITVRFLSNEIGAGNIKIIVHEKNCKGNVNNCSIKEIDSRIKNELLSQILKSASILEKNKSSKKN